MEKLCFRICNQAGIQAIIECDGIWVKIGESVRKHFFLKNLDESWFNNPKAYLSFSGSFLYLIVDGDLHLITLASNKDSIVYDDNLTILANGTKFNDANFSYEETLIYGLTNSSIFVFSLLPPKKIQEFILDWGYISHSFKIMFLPPSHGFGLRNAFLVESRGKSEVKTETFVFPSDSNLDPSKRLILKPIAKTEEAKGERNYKKVEKDEEEDNFENPTTKEEAANMLLARGNQLLQYERDNKQRLKDLESRIDYINNLQDNLQEQCQQSRERFENLFARIERLIETADGGIGLVQMSEQQQSYQNLLQSLDNKRPYHELNDDIIFQYRSLEKSLAFLQYNLDLLKRSL